MPEYVKEELTPKDVIGESAKSLVDLLVEAKKKALKEDIKANTVLLDKTFAKVNDIYFVVGRDILHIPPMICGLEVRLTDELPDGYDFALIEAPETERDRIIRTAKSEVERLKDLNERYMSELSKASEQIAFMKRAKELDKIPRW